MPHQNRVIPFGELIATSARGTFMGNRSGVLHNDQRELTDRRWINNRWIICLLEFKGRERRIMKPNHYTELFFLDEATALAAGHRPCGECRREDFNRFKSAWVKGNPQYGFTEKIRIGEIDRILQEERVMRNRNKVTYDDQLGNLPDGTFVTLLGKPEAACLIWKGELKVWSQVGYVDSSQYSSDLMVTVLTPESSVNALRAGYAPHMSS